MGLFETVGSIGIYGFLVVLYSFLLVVACVNDLFYARDVVMFDLFYIAGYILLMIKVFKKSKED
jgi:hypothetical protein